MKGASVIDRLVRLLPWRLRSRNNFAMAVANAFFRGVLDTPPQPVDAGCATEIHSLICHRDVNMMLTSAKSFLRFVRPAALVLHDDGTLTAADAALIHAHLPGTRIIPRKEADAELQRLLPADVFAKRQAHFFLLKLFDFNHFHNGSKTILLDSDIVFLAPPQEIIDWVAGKTLVPFYNLDWCPSYRAGSLPVGVSIPPSLNAGFMGYDGRFTLERIWQCCRSVDYWLEDQTIYALLLAGSGARALDAERYRVYTGGEVSAQTPMVHFISPSRFKTLLYPRLARSVYRQLGRS